MSMITAAIKDAEAIIERLSTASAYPDGHYGRFMALSEASIMANGLNNYISKIPHDERTNH